MTPLLLAEYIAAVIVGVGGSFIVLGLLGILALRALMRALD